MRCVRAKGKEKDIKAATKEGAHNASYLCKFNRIGYILFEQLADKAASRSNLASITKRGQSRN